MDISISYGHFRAEVKVTEKVACRFASVVRIVFAAVVLMTQHM